MTEVLYLKCKPLPIEEGRSFFFFFFEMTLFHRDVVSVDWLKRPMRSDKPSWLSVT